MFQPGIQNLAGLLAYRFFGNMLVGARPEYIGYCLFLECPQVLQWRLSLSSYFSDHSCALLCMAFLFLVVDDCIGCVHYWPSTIWWSRPTTLCGMIWSSSSKTAECLSISCSLSFCQLLLIQPTVQRWFLPKWLCLLWEIEVWCTKCEEVRLTPHILLVTSADT